MHFKTCVCELNKPPTFIDRQVTNESIYTEIREQHGCVFEHFGETWKRSKLRLFGHILRAHSSDPMKQVSLAADGLHPRAVCQRRSGRPRADWITESYKDAFTAMFPGGALFDVNDVNHASQSTSTEVTTSFRVTHPGFGLSR